MIAALATALGLGGVICICVSLTCGGCDPTDGLELEQWEKTRNIDNALLSLVHEFECGATSIVRVLGGARKTEQRGRPWYQENGVYNGFIMGIDMRLR